MGLIALIKPKIIKLNYIESMFRLLGIYNIYKLWKGIK